MARVHEVVVTAPPDDALFASVAVLRRLGARITRYDVEAGTLEARVHRFWRPRLIRVRAQADGTATRVIVESDALTWTPLFRRLRAEIRPDR